MATDTPAERPASLCRAIANAAARPRDVERRGRPLAPASRRAPPDAPDNFAVWRRQAAAQEQEIAGLHRFDTWNGSGGAGSVMPRSVNVARRDDRPPSRIIWVMLSSSHAAITRSATRTPLDDGIENRVIGSAQY